LPTPPISPPLRAGQPEDIHSLVGVPPSQRGFLHQLVAITNQAPIGGYHQSGKKCFTKAAFGFVSMKLVF